jgi:rhodanese-related sulfurtransferase
MLALAGMAALAALLSNALAVPARRLAWLGGQVAGRTIAPQGAMVRPAEPVLPPPIAPPAQAAQAATPRPAATSGKHPLPPRAPAQAQPTTASSPIQEISPQEAWAAFQSGAAFLDARRSSEFTEGHVPGAWCAPVWEADLEDRLIAFKAARHPGPEDPIVIYCSGGDCKDSQLLAARLLNDGYFHLLIYRGGFPDWVAQGHPVQKGQP